MFNSVLVANRGEIAVRVMRTLRRMRIRSIAVYSDADATAPHVEAADEAVRIGPAPAAESYLSSGAIVEAARRAGADAVHPGYGFLSESAAFARACEEAGLVFVGPPAEVIEAMGDKIRAKRIAVESGVAVVPGRAEMAMTDADLVGAAEEIGYPVLVKPSAGGGGKGMRLVERRELLEAAIVSARREARAAFGDDTLFVERFVTRPRHIEIQVFADSHGRAVHLGERECTLQRRHQKVVEESPSPLVDAERRKAMGEDALRVAVACGYVGAGTVEFVVPSDHPDEHYFLEMNTRLQVEHPVTELVRGVDLVEWQLRVAAGEPLPEGGLGHAPSGHAIEARLYAEDPGRGFLPTGGTLLRYREPAVDGVRIDGGVAEGSVVGSLYDPMLAKVIAFAQSRNEALATLRRALREYVVLGVQTNLTFLVALLSDPGVERGELDTGLTERLAADFSELGPPEALVRAAAVALACELEPRGGVVDPWEVPGAWRLGGAAWTRRVLVFDDRHRAVVAWRGRAGEAEVRIGEGAATAASGQLSGEVFEVASGGEARRYACVRSGERWFLGGEEGTFSFQVTEDPPLRKRSSGTSAEFSLRSPMPGSVVAVSVAEGDQVEPGRVLVVVEAMKMEHPIIADRAGTVERVLVGEGDRVNLDQPLVMVAFDDTAANEETRR